MTDEGLLSRIAETLYWTGRYVERADDTARTLDVYVHHMLEDPEVDEDSDCRAMLAILGVPATDDGAMDIGMALSRLAYDPQEPERDRGRDPGRAGGRAQRAGRRLERDVGMPERHRSRPELAPAIR